MHFDIERFHAGEEQFFTELVSHYSPRLLPTLRRYTSPDTDTHDLLQDVWLRAYSKRKTFDGRGSFIGWLLTVSRTVGMTAIRKRARVPAVAELRAATAAPDPAAGIMRDALREAVLTLPEREREVVLLRLIEGRSTRETAQLLQCAEGTVKAALHHATQKLRGCLKETPL